MDESTGIIDLIENRKCGAGESPELQDLAMDLSTASVLSLTAAETGGRAGALLPHPWTGVSTRICYLFARVGRLVRAEVMRIRSRGVSTLLYASRPPTWVGIDEDDRLERKRMLSRASQLESQLLDYAPPRPDRISPTGDANTPVDELLDQAHSHHLCAMLHI